MAAASKQDVLRAWSGLGYNSRALRFHQLSKIIAKEFHSRLPADADILQQLPGIGRYTAHAIACFAYGMSVPVVDVNVKRIFTRLFSEVTASDAMMDDKRAWQMAGEILPPDDAYNWNQALMDLGATICTAVNPECEACPFTNRCSSAHLPALSRRSLRAPRKEPSFNGVPRRIIRGTILKQLHARAQDVAALRLQLPVRLRRDELLSILSTMQNDGLIAMKKQRGRIRISIARS